MKLHPHARKRVPHKTVKKHLLHGHQKHEVSFADYSEAILDTSCAAAAEAIADALVEQLAPPNALLSAHAQQERKKREICEAVDNKPMRLQIAGAINDVVDMAPEPVVNAMRDGVQALLAQGEKMALASQQPLAEIFHLTPDMFQSIYQIGHGLFSDGLHERARNIMLLLTLLQPMAPDLWHALAVVEGTLQENDAALTHVSMAIMLDPDCVPYRLEAARLYLATGDRESARIELEEATRAAELHQQVAQWADQIQQLIASQNSS